MWESLQRAGGHFSDDAQIDQLEDGSYFIKLFLKDTLPPSSVLHVYNFIREYGAECGWKVKKVSLQKTYVLMVVDRESSKLFKKPSTRPSTSKTEPKP